MQVQYEAYPVQTRSQVAKTTPIDQPLIDIGEPSPPLQENPIEPEPPSIEVPINTMVELPNDCYVSVSTLHVHPKLLKSVARHLPSDPSFSKIYGELTKIYKRTKNDPDGPYTTLYCFRRDVKSKLLFFRDRDRERVCIPRKCFFQLFKMAHDDIAHIGTDRVYRVL